MSEAFRLIAKDGEGITAELRSWSGPIEAGQAGRYVWSPPLRFARDQGKVKRLNQRVAIGFTPEGERWAASQSVSYWPQLEKHLRWTLAKEGGDGEAEAA